MKQEKMTHELLLFSNLYRFAGKQVLFGCSSCNITKQIMEFSFVVIPILFTQINIIHFI